MEKKPICAETIYVYMNNRKGTIIVVRRKIVTIDRDNQKISQLFFEA